jgi:hypothetical protein
VLCVDHLFVDMSPKIDYAAFGSGIEDAIDIQLLQLPR